MKLPCYVVLAALFTFFVSFGISSTKRLIFKPSEILKEQSFRLQHKQEAASRMKQKYLPEDFGSGISCDLCELIVGGLQIYAGENRTVEEFVRFITGICKDFKIEDDRVCEEVTVEFKDEVVGVIQGIVLSPHEVCGIVIGDKCAIPYNPLGFWNITLPSIPKPPVIPPKAPSKTAPKVRFLHLTDIHLDMMYEAGTNAECGEPLCCRSNDGKPEPGVPGAGQWGDYRQCDASPDLLDNLFKHLSSIQHQFDFVIFTGDIPAHNIWHQSRADQTRAVERLTSMFKKYLPGKPVYNAVGNHDTAPVNSFPPPFITGKNSITWMYKVLAKSWGTWLPPETKATILKGAYYTVSPYPGFRIVAINTNYCSSQNWWLMINSTDPADQLQWLVGVLQKAEDNEEKVYIIGHHPTASCLKAWSWNYYRIVNRYESTIVNQFFGHSHNDLFTVYYDDVHFKRPVSVAYIPGSITSNSNLNPGFRINEIDGFYKNSSFAVLDFQNYYVDLIKANNGSTAQWEYEYDPKVAYNMANLYPSDWSSLIYRMKKDDDLFNAFYKYNSKSTERATCTGECKFNQLCSLKTARSDSSFLCNDLRL